MSVQVILILSYLLLVFAVMFNYCYANWYSLLLFFYQLDNLRVPSKVRSYLYLKYEAQNIIYGVTYHSLIHTLINISKLKGFKNEMTEPRNSVYQYTINDLSYRIV